MESITQWLEQLCLTLNTGKTKGMYFSKMTVFSSSADTFQNGEKRQKLLLSLIILV